jgi:hypothetical protein
MEKELDITSLKNAVEAFRKSIKIGVILFTDSAKTD